MTKKQLDKGNEIHLKINQSKQRVKAFRNLFTRDPSKDHDIFKMYFLDPDGRQCVINSSDWDYEDILKALIKYEDEIIEKLEKEFEEL